MGETVDRRGGRRAGRARSRRNLGRGGGRPAAAGFGAVLPAAGGACCAGLGAGLVTAGGVLGAALAWLSPLLLGVALATVGGLVLWWLSGRPWRRWQRVVAVAAASYAVSALVLVPVLAALLDAGGSSPTALP